MRGMAQVIQFRDMFDIIGDDELSLVSLDEVIERGVGARQVSREVKYLVMRELRVNEFFHRKKKPKLDMVDTTVCTQDNWG